MRAFILLIAATVAGSAGGRPFTPDLGTPWTFSSRDGMCLLERPVRDFGTVRFVGVPGEPLRLEVLGHRVLFAAGEVSLSSAAPPWRPDYPSERELGSARQEAGSVLLVPDPLATRVLMSLYDGYEAHMHHAAWYGGEADVRIGNEYLRPHYESFARCLRSVTSAGWSAYERTRIEYGSEQVDLTDQDRVRLRQVAEYVLAVPDVGAVFVDGHTDDVGSVESNVALSRLRAEGVADFLVRCGVPRSRLVVRYHGAEYPVARGNSEAARSQNRRTTVRLERDVDGDLASR